MKVRYMKSKWEVPHLSYKDFIDKTDQDGFDGVELCLLADDLPEVSWLKEYLQSMNKEILAQVIMCRDQLPKEQIEAAKEQIAYAEAAGAKKVNVHAGSDFFTFEENAQIFREVIACANECSVIPTFETHRGRALFNLPDTLDYLEAIPELLLTADISHFMCVHESDLAERADLLKKLMPRVSHIHARVGYPQASQVAQPFAPEWQDLLQYYRVNLWEPMLRSAKQRGFEEITVTPEAGPPESGYMATVPFSNVPLADTWKVNVTMKEWLQRNLEIPA